jgi:uncharacterized membrane protein
MSLPIRKIVQAVVMIQKSSPMIIFELSFKGYSVNYQKKNLDDSDLVMSFFPW